MNLYRLLYRIVAVVVLLVGLALMPFLGFFIKDSSGIEHLRLIYLMYVANSVCSYLLSYKNSIWPTRKPMSATSGRSSATRSRRCSKSSSSC